MTPKSGIMNEIVWCVPLLRCFFCCFDQAAIRAFLQGLPVAVLDPLVSASEAMAVVAQGARNQLDPSSCADHDVKFKT